MVTHRKTQRSSIMRLVRRRAPIISKNLYVMLCSDLLEFLRDRGDCFGYRLQAVNRRDITAQDIRKFSVRCIIGQTAPLERCPKEDYTLDITLPISHEDFLSPGFDLRIFAFPKCKVKGLLTIK
jgi:hypothetical protein